jgi:mono/diheme cytochrome c family protein
MSRLHAWLQTVGLAVLGLTNAAAPAYPAPDAAHAFFEQHCLDCHSGAKPEAGLDLTTLPRDLTDAKTMRTMVRIHDRVARGEMPPADAERPSAEDVVAVTRLLDERLSAADSARIRKSGRARMRRMTVPEFENTLRDLLALERLEIRDLFPDDARVAGFTKIGDGLDISPVLLDTFATAAEKALTDAIATRSDPPPVFKRRFHPTSTTFFIGNLLDEQAVLIKDMQWDAIQPLTTEKYEFPPGTKKDEIRAAATARREARKTQFTDLGIWERPSAVGMLGHPNGGVGGGVSWAVNTIFPGRYRLRCSVWAFTWNKGRIEPVDAPQAATLWAADTSGELERQLLHMTALSLAPREHEITTWLDAQESLVIDPVSVHSRRLHGHRQRGEFLPDYVGPGVAIDWYEVEGPIFESWPPESHRRLFGDLPIAALPADSQVIPPRRTFLYAQVPRNLPVQGRDLPAQDMKRPLETVQSSTPLEDARRLLADFLPRALRRPVAAAAVEPYMAIVKSRLEDGDCFEDAMKRAYVAILTSPDFLFHPADTQCDQHGLAARLSYWLWNSPPDAELLAAAETGSLADPKVLHAQVDRLLDDPRSNRFIADFTDQWLDLWRIDETMPDRALYPEFTLPLQADMLAETRGFIRELIAEDLPVRNLVDSPFALLNQRLAELYGLPAVAGVEVRKVALPPESVRGGLLTQASILKLTANGTVTSPVKRGVWVMDRLLDDPPLPPPENVPAIDPDTRGATTIREQLALHSNQAACAVCHVKIDPAGFALEAFDVMGGHRDRYRSTLKGDPAPEAVRERWLAQYRLGPAVDASGQLPDGRSFADVRGLKLLLADDPRQLARAFAAHMIRYATGADITYADRREIEGVVDAAAPSQYGLRSLIHAIAASPLLGRLQQPR